MHLTQIHGLVAKAVYSHMILIWNFYTFKPAPTDNTFKLDINWHDKYSYSKNSLITENIFNSMMWSYPHPWQWRINQKCMYSQRFQTIFKVFSSKVPTSRPIKNSTVDPCLPSIIKYLQENLLPNYTQYIIMCMPYITLCIYIYVTEHYLIFFNSYFFLFWWTG